MTVQGHIHAFLKLSFVVFVVLGSDNFTNDFANGFANGLANNFANDLRIGYIDRKVE